MGPVTCWKLRRNIASIMKIRFSIAFFLFRLAQFASRDEESGIPNEIMLFDIFSKEIAYIIDVSKVITANNF